MLDGEAIEGLSVRQRQHAGLRYVTDDRLGEGTVSAFPVGLNLLLKRIGDAPFWRHGIIRNAEVERHARALIAEHDVRVPGPGTHSATSPAATCRRRCSPASSTTSRWP